MATRPPTTPVQPASGAVRFFVPGYLTLFGLILLGLSGYLFGNYPDETFTAVLSLVGGLTMLGTMALMVTVGRRG